MNYLIIGAGGTGGCIAAYLARAGQHVTVIARGRHLEAIRKHGLAVRSARIGDFTVFPDCTCTMEEYSGTPDVIFVCVKYYSLPETTAFINRIAGTDTLVIPILNVFGTGAVIQEACPAPTVLDGCIYIYSRIESPGVICQATPIFNVFFGFRDGQGRRLQGRAEQTAQELRDAEINARFTEEIKREALQKFSFVSPMGAAGLYHHAAGGALMVPGKEQDTFLSLIREVGALGEAMGITFTVDLEAFNMEILNGLDKDSTTSMQRDVLSGGCSEIDGLVHRVVRLADQYHVDVPTYRMISEWAKKEGIN